MVDREILHEPLHSLDEARARMSFAVEEGSFALIGFEEPVLAADLECACRPPAQVVSERDETTLLVREELADQVLARHPRARTQRGLCWIRFDAAMGWDLVGFLALVTGELARAGVPIGAVCGFSRDHLFVQRERLPAARAALRRLFPEHESEREPNRENGGSSR